MVGEEAFNLAFGRALRRSSTWLQYTVKSCVNLLLSYMERITRCARDVSGKVSCIGASLKQRMPFSWNQVII
jgi:hypothetical protein